MKKILFLFSSTIAISLFSTSGIPADFWQPRGYTDIAQEQTCRAMSHKSTGGYCIDYYYSCMENKFGKNFIFPIPMEPGYHNDACGVNR